MGHSLEPFSTRSRKVLVISLVVIMVVGFASSQAVTSTDSPKLPSAPVHVSHPMKPFTSSGAASPATSPISCPLASGQCLVDINWAGYSICGESPGACSACFSNPSTCQLYLGDVTYVKGTWTVPRITDATGQSCSDSQNTWYDASDWVGIDGLISYSVEQTGTSSDCFYGQVQYYAWYEFYPQPSYNINIPINPGDSITASVTCLHAAPNIDCSTTLTDNTNGQSFTTSTSVPDSYCTSTGVNAGTYCLDSAEWIEEDAWNDGFLALTPVTPVVFTNGVATIGGQTRQMSAWGPQLWGLTTATFEYPTVQTTSTVKSAESAIGFGSMFSIKYYSSGP